MFGNKNVKKEMKLLCVCERKESERKYYKDWGILIKIGEFKKLEMFK